MSALSKAVVLAAGRGSRMRADRPGVRASPAQRRMAGLGFKSMIPIHGQPFLAFVLSALADAGIRDVCLVIASGSNPVRDHFGRALAPRRIGIDFAVQEEPLGSAHALSAAEPFTAGDDFLVINADNHYPPQALTPLHALAGSGLAGFDRETLIARGGIPAARLAGYALVTGDADGFLADIIEKPDAARLRELAGRSYVSMTCWRFTPAIFTAARAIDRSPRGELELPDAVRYAVRELGERFVIVPTAEPVLDLSVRDDIAVVDAALRAVSVCL